MNIERKIRLFFVYYGRLLFTCIAIIALTIFIIQSLNSYVAKRNKQDLLYNKSDLKERKEEIKEREYITVFINYCNTKKIDEAYNMLSDKCKEERYSTISEFKINYIDRVFNTNICNYKIEKKDNIYKVILTEDMLMTGNIDSNRGTIIKIEKISEYKIYIYN